MKDHPGENYTEAETEARFKATLKRMLATPHKPHKAGETKPRPGKPRG